MREWLVCLLLGSAVASAQAQTVTLQPVCGEGVAVVTMANPVPVRGVSLTIDAPGVTLLDAQCTARTAGWTCTANGNRVLVVSLSGATVGAGEGAIVRFGAVEGCGALRITGADVADAANQPLGVAPGNATCPCPTTTSTAPPTSSTLATTTSTISSTSTTMGTPPPPPSTTSTTLPECRGSKARCGEKWPEPCCEGLVCRRERGPLWLRKCLNP